MSTVIEDEAKRPWYKQPWLWFLLSVPIASVILSSIMVTVAVVGKDSLVSDNYYKEGMAINQTLEQDRLANSLSINPMLAFDDKYLVVTLNANETHPEFVKQAFLTIKLLHPTVSDKDIILKLLPGADGRFVAELNADQLKILDGRRYVDLYAFDESWRVRNEVIFPITETFLIKQAAAP